MMKSILFQPNPPFVEPDTCKPGREETLIPLVKDGRVYEFTITDKLVCEDPYIVLVKAGAFAIQTDEPLMAVPPPRAIRDVLIKVDLKI